MLNVNLPLSTLTSLNIALLPILILAVEFPATSLASTRSITAPSLFSFNQTKLSVSSNELGAGVSVASSVELSVEVSVTLQ